MRQKTQGDSHVKTEANTGEMLLKAKEPPGLSEPQKLGERHGTCSPSEHPKGTSPGDTLILDLWPLEL